jgi:hypothetical protein
MEPVNLTTKPVFENSRNLYHGKKLKAWESCINIPYLKINSWGLYDIQIQLCVALTTL